MKRRIPAFLLPACLLFGSGCGLVQYEPRPLDPAAVQGALRGRRADDPGFLAFARDVRPGAAADAARWDLSMLTLAALYFNPALRVAQDEYELSRRVRQTAAQYPNPSLNLPLEHHSDTSGEKSAWTAGTVLDFIYERRGKREARIAAAQARSEAARLHVHETAWDIRGRLHRACLDYYLARQKEKLAQQRLDLLRRKLALLRSRYQLGETGSADVNAAELAVQEARLDLSGARAGVSDGYHGLIGVTGLPASAFGEIDLSLADMSELEGAGRIEEDALQASALLHRTDIRRALSEYRAVEQALRLEIEKQYPDITLSPGLIFDQGDNIWTLGASWVLPLFNNHEGPIGEALAKRKIMRSRFLELQSDLLNRLNETLNRYKNLQSNLSVSRRIVREVEKRRRAVENQYQQGYSDRLAVIEAGLQLNDSRQAVLTSRGRLLETIVQLEELAQKPLPGEIDIDKAIDNLFRRDAGADGRLAGTDAEG